MASFSLIFSLLQFYCEEEPTNTFHDYCVSWFPVCHLQQLGKDWAALAQEKVIGGGKEWLSDSGQGRTVGLNKPFLKILKTEMQNVLES